MLRYAMIGMACAALCSGCSTNSVLKRGWTELRGASGDVVPIRDCNPSFCQSVGAIEPGRVSNSIAPLGTRVVSLLQSALVEESANASAGLAGSAPAKVDVDVTFYNPPGGVETVIGKSGLLVARARIVDGAGSPQGDLLIAVSTEAVRSGETDMAQTCAKTICEYIADRADGD